MTNRAVSFITCGFLLLVLSTVGRIVNAQEADSTSIGHEMVADSTADSVADTLMSGESISQTEVLPGFNPRSRFPGFPLYPPISSALEVNEQLSNVPGSFSYDLSTPGWPSFWTIYGKSPSAVDVSWDGFSFDELYTGRPAYDLLPRGLLDTLGIDLGSAASPLIYTRTRTTSAGPPLTELAYRTSNKGMQYVYASHAQQRSRSLFGRPGLLGIRAGYMGQKADGEYPGSKLERGRSVYTALDVHTRQLRFELSNLASRRRVGAHGGVIAPVPGDPNSIYQRFGALVSDQSAERRSTRNDVTARVTAGSGKRTWSTLSTRWTTQLFRFRNSADTLRVESGRSLASASIWHRVKTVVVGGHVEASNEWISDHTFLTGMVLEDLARYSGGITAARDGRSSFYARGGVNSFDGNTSYDLALSIEARTRLIAANLTASRSVPDPAHMEVFGFGRFATVDADIRGYVNDARVALKIQARPFSLSITPFVFLEENPRDWIQTDNADSIIYRADSRDRRTSGVSILLGFRTDAARGFYSYIDATSLSRAFLGSGDSGTEPEQWTNVGPDRYATAVAGLRYLLFKGDLDGNFYLRSRLWPDYTGYGFHRQTGLPVLPGDNETEEVVASATLDLIVEAGVRGATVFFSYENLLSGTNLVVGNQLVAGYPLAQRRLRFGVFWPILN